MKELRESIQDYNDSKISYGSVIGATQNFIERVDKEGE